MRERLRAGLKAKQDEDAKAAREKGRLEVDERVKKAWPVPTGNPAAAPPNWAQGEWKRTLEDGRLVTLCVIGGKTMLWDEGNPVIVIRSVEIGEGWCIITTNLSAASDEAFLRICVRKVGEAVSIGVVRSLNGKPCVESPWPASR